jgi:hypothetical protein
VQGSGLTRMDRGKQLGFFMYLTWSISAYNSLKDGRD